MTINTKRFIKSVSVCAALCGILHGCGGTRPQAVETGTAGQVAVASPTPEGRRGCPPQDLQAQMGEIARVTGGSVGVGVMLVETGESVSLNGAQKFPMQSVYKLPIAMAVLHQVDAGALALEQKVKVEKSDFVLGGQRSPIRDAHPRGVELSVRDLLSFMVSESDGTACDVLLKTLGGPEQASQYLRESSLPDINVVSLEKELGRDPSIQYQNSATPESMLRLLRALQEGHGLSASSRSFLLDIMTKSVPGPKRIKGMLPTDAAVAHKTGTSGTTNGLTSATNDVGLITLPDGRHLAVAVFVSDTKVDEATREGVIARIARAAWDCWTGQ